MQRINDRYSVKGNRIEEFKKELESMVDITTVAVEPLTEDYVFLSVLDIRDEDILVLFLNEDFIKFFKSGAFFTASLTEEGTQKKFSFIKTIKKAYFTNNFMEEPLTVNDLIVWTKDKTIHLIAEEAFKTFLVRYKLSCEAMLSKTLARNVMLVDQIYQNSHVLSSVVKRQNEKGRSKIMAVLSDKYVYIPQIILNEVVCELEKHDELSCNGFEIDNRKSYIYLDFTKKSEEIADLYKIDAVPGIYLASSDTGDCSITAKAFFRFGRSVVTVGEITRRHEGNIEKNVLLDGINNTLFPLFTVIPDKLVQLMSIDINNPEVALKKALKHAKLVELIGKKNELAVSEQLIAELNPSMQYTAYNIAVMCLQIAERITNLSDDYKRKLEKGIIKVIDYDFSKVSQTQQTAFLKD